MYILHFPFWLIYDIFGKKCFLSRVLEFSGTAAFMMPAWFLHIANKCVECVSIQSHLPNSRDGGNVPAYAENTNMQKHLHRDTLMMACFSVASLTLPAFFFSKLHKSDYCIRADISFDSWDERSWRHYSELDVMITAPRSLAREKTFQS